MVASAMVGIECKAAPAELRRLAEAISEFRAGNISDIELRAVRVPLGVYEQRTPGTFMLRARCPGGVLTPKALARVAEVSSRYGNGVLHVTTRQNVQIHGVPLDSIDLALRALAEAEVSTRGGGGNTVRNLTTCAEAGVCREECFNVSPWAKELSERLLPDPGSYTLPRKLKIAFAGCARDCSGVLVHDLGFIAQCKDGAPGFAVYLGGGLGARSRIADLFLEFIPARDAYLVAEAVKRVFDQHGNRRDRHRARLRFLVADLGIERFRALFEAQRSKLSAQLVDRNRLAAAFVSPPVGNDNTPSRWPSAEPNATCQWRARCVAPQRQAGLNRVTIALPLGDLKSETALALAGVVKQFGERTLRATQDQNLLLRSVRDEELDALHGKLATLGLAQSTPTVIQRMAACTGATTCKLGLCNSRGLATELARVLADSGLELDAIGDATIKISGCPNACGQHPIAAIGLVGAARHVGERLVPHYIVQLGGQLGEGKTQLATGTAAVSARHVPRLVKDLLAAYVGSRAAGGFAEFLAAKGRALVATLSQQYRLDATDQDFATHWVDWGADEPFSLSGRAGK